MPASRDEILNRIRSRQWEGQDLPDLNQTWIRYDSPQHQFAETLRAVGGRCVIVNSPEEACADLRHFEPFAQAKKTVSCVDRVGCSNFDVSAVTDPHDLEDVDFAILPGELAVAENAAVWVTDEQVPHRVLYFLPQHLALVVPAARLVHTMHEALSQIDVAKRAFGSFISGPSKTADIEQSLVIGAHGPRSLTVILLGT